MKLTRNLKNIKEGDQVRGFNGVEIIRVAQITVKDKLYIFADIKGAYLPATEANGCYVDKD